MNTYIKGFFKYLGRRNVSCISLITDDSSVSDRAVVTRGCKLNCSKIGDYSYLAPDTELIHTSIGKYCSVGKDCLIGMANHPLDRLSTSPVFSESNNRLRFSYVEQDTISTPYKEILIENDVWIGNRVVILGGVKIGNGAVIGAGAVVTKDIPPYAIVGGVPARVIRYRFDSETIDSLERLKWWEKEEHWIKENLQVFQCTENMKDIVESLQ